MNKCAKCGACTVVCPVYNASGKECYSARGKNHLLEVYEPGKVSSTFEDIFSKCLLCGACTKVCPRGIDIVETVTATRAEFDRFYGAHGYEKYLARKVLEKPKLLQGARLVGNIASKLAKALPAESGLRLRLAMFDTDIKSSVPESKEKPVTSANTQEFESLTYFPGCSASYLYPKTIDSTKNLVQELGYSLHIPSGLGCCGLAQKAAGDFDKARSSAKRNIEILEKTTDPILVTCGSCWAHIKNYSDLFTEEPDWQQRAQSINNRLKEITQFLAARISEQTSQQQASKTSELRVFYHDPCHLRNENQVTAEPRKVLSSVPNFTLLELEDGPQCCGSGGLFTLGAPELSGIIGDDLATKVLNLQPDVITTTCSSCYMQWKTMLAKHNSSVKLVFFTELLNDKLVV